MTGLKYNQSFAHTTISATAAIKATPGKVMGIQVYTPTNVNGKVEIFNSTDGSGTAVLTLGNGGITNGFGGSHLEDYTPFGGRQCSTAIYCTITGSGVLVTIWYD